MTVIYVYQSVAYLETRAWSCCGTHRPSDYRGISLSLSLQVKWRGLAAESTKRTGYKLSLLMVREKAKQR